MTNLTKTQKVFYDIPEHMEKELEEEIRDIYKAIANDTIPILDEITKQLTYFVLMLAYGEANVELDSLADCEITDMLNNFFGQGKFRESYIHLRKNVKYYLKTHNYFYEDNWLYAPCMLDYEQRFVSSPLQSVW